MLPFQLKRLYSIWFFTISNKCWYWKIIDFLRRIEDYTKLWIWNQSCFCIQVIGILTNHFDLYWLKFMSKPKYISCVLNYVVSQKVYKKGNRNMSYFKFFSCHFLRFMFQFNYFWPLDNHLSAPFRYFNILFTSIIFVIHFTYFFM